ncbi:MAG: single-stranded-DNA-specific exonuclease RecJ [Thermoflexales bacterium]|nr:single-stranded-DNA-specific exonuclease RecJ [Thermoflexales bacterium]
MAAPADFAAAIGGHPIVADVLWARGFRDLDRARAFLDPERYAPRPPGELPGMAEAVARLSAARAHGERVRVWGDFDVDGQTATSTLVVGLRALGVVVDYSIPNRLTHSHGLNREGLQRAQADGVRVLLTCDCGVTDFAEIAAARALGLDVIITDHHDLARDAAGAVLLPDDVSAVVNPKRLPEDHPLGQLPGVGVAWKLIQALGQAIDPGFDPDPLLDLVALGIVADVAHQAADTRHLLQRGLRRLREAPRPGIRALLRTAGLTAGQVTADEIGFQLGPRLNAAGRLDTAERSVQLLIAATDAEAKPLAESIEALNLRRRELQRAVEESAARLLGQHPEWLEGRALVMASAEWHPSVLGVVASGYAERLGKPAMLIAADEAGPPALARGSARSVSGIDINAAILAQGELIAGGGGHPLAAGFAIPSQNIAAFRVGIDAWLRAAPGVAAASGDADEAFDIPLREAGLALVMELERLAPFGPGNPRPMLRSAPVEVARIELLGRDGRHQRVWLRDAAGEQRELVWWRSAGQSVIAGPCAAVFTARRNVYRGQERPQLQLERFAEATPAAAPTGAPARAAVTGQRAVLDLRGRADREAAVEAFLDAQGRERVFALGAWPGLPALPRPLTAQPALLVLEAPPGLAEWEHVLAVVAPQRVALATAPPDARADGIERVLRQARGLLETARARGDDVDDAQVLARMAARIGQRIETLRCAFDVVLGRDAGVARGRLAYLLEETHAFRRFFHQAASGTF